MCSRLITALAKGMDGQTSHLVICIVDRISQRRSNVLALIFFECSYRRASNVNILIFQFHKELSC